MVINMKAPLSILQICLPYKGQSFLRDHLTVHYYCGHLRLVYCYYTCTHTMSSMSGHYLFDK